MHLLHDAVGEDRGGGEVRKLLEGVDDHTRLVHLRLAFRALAHVRAERSDAEPDVAVHEQIDFVRK